jgi:RNA polymerase sigma factor (TIGR02999 family)
MCAFFSDMSERPDPSLTGQVTALLQRWSGGDKEAAGVLFPIVYGELRRLARGQRRRLRAGETLNTTAVVHEAYLKLVDAPQVSARDRQHFLALAARAMRQILVDHARRQRALKRGGEARHTPLDGSTLLEAPARDVLGLDDALNRLAALDPRLVQLVELRFFTGLSVDETAAVLGIAPRTVDRDWQRARAFLHHEMRTAGGGDES